MKRTSWVTVACVAVLALSGAAYGGVLGKVVSIGGHASDLVLDEARGVLYVANFTANRIEVMSLTDGTIQRSINVNPQPGSIALSPDGRYLVVAQYGNLESPAPSNSGLTVIDLDSGNKQVYSMPDTPLGVAFAINGRALVLTTSIFLLFDPVSGSTQVLDSISNAVSKTLPQPLGNFPPNIIEATVVASGDGMRIFGQANTFEFYYDVTSTILRVFPYISVPPQGPRAVSVPFDGSYYVSGWVMADLTGQLISQFPNPAGLLNVGSHAVDSARGLIYSQVPKPAAAAGASTPASLAAPVLTVHDADNLAVRERYNLAENLAGKSVLSSDGALMFSISDSGITIIPVGQLNRVPRVTTSREDLVFRGNFCDQRVYSQELTILDPGGGNTDFALGTTLAGVTITPSRGVTPATVRVNVDPAAYQNQRGTVSGTIEVFSTRAVNQPPAVRILINNHEPDQRGTFVNLPGKLVDILPDSGRNRFYVLRQDRNDVVVLDSTNLTQIATLRTANTPTQMAITFDSRYMLVGHDNANIVKVFDLETLQPDLPIKMPGGHYPRSIAVSSRAILVANRVAGPKHTIDRVDFLARRATELPSLGVYKNDININTTLVSNPNGSSIMAASADGNVFLYSANADTFTVSRKDFTSLSGAYAASSFDLFVVNNLLLNSSLAPIGRFDGASGTTSGFSFIDQYGIRTSAVNATSPGVIQRMDLTTGASLRSTRMIEAPRLTEASTQQGPAAATIATQTIFTRTVAPLLDRSAIVNLTTSGFTVLPWEYDVAVASPRIERVVNAADGSRPVAPGGLISLFGRDLSPVSLATRQMPLPTALGESCLTVNGLPVPMVFVSPAQINGQLPFQAEGSVTMMLRTPGGVSDNFYLTVLPAAPSIFRTPSSAAGETLPTVVKTTDESLVTAENPIHSGDDITIYLTGMGKTSPVVEAGVPAPDDPPASAVIPATVTLGGVELAVRFAGLAPGEVGVYRIQARVPGGAPVGSDQALTIRQGGSSTSVAVRVE